VQGCCFYSRAAERKGAASAVVNASRVVGGTLGVALLGSLVARGSLVEGLHLAGYICAGAFFLVAAQSLSCMSTPMVDCGRLLPNRVGALRFALAEGDVFVGGLDQVDEDIIGRDSCRDRDAGVQVLQQRESRLS
jgi:hypothetical protein